MDLEKNYHEETEEAYREYRIRYCKYKRKAWRQLITLMKDIRFGDGNINR